jgi:DNA-binding transcriptional ArsR family regulator
VPRRAAHADVFLAVADPTRRALLDRLRAGSAPVAELAEGFRMSRPAVSKHLTVLRRAGLVRERREGRQRRYRLEPAPLREVAAWAETYRAFWQSSLEALQRHLERKEHP